MFKINNKSSVSRTIAAATLLGLFMQNAGLACNLTEYPFPWHLVNNSVNSAKVLHDYDVALLIDSSHSMKYEYFPAQSFLEVASDINPGRPITSSKGHSRWDWCRAHAAQLTKESLSVLNHGPRLTVFGDQSIMYKDVVNAASVSKVFSSMKPHGGTFAAKALSQEVNTYFENRKKTNGNTKPLLIAMITDGSLSDIMSSRNVLVNATKKMNRSDEIAVVILKVGEDPKAPPTLEMLDNKLVSKYDAKYDIVDVKSFDELNGRGIAPVLADVMREKRASRVISYNAN